MKGRISPFYFCVRPVSPTFSPFRMRNFSATCSILVSYSFLLKLQSGYSKMKVYTVSILALVALSSARPQPSGGGGGELGQGQGQGQGDYSYNWRHKENYKKGKNGRKGSPATTAFPTMSSGTGGYGGAGTAGAGAGGYQPPGPTSSAVRGSSYQGTSEYSKKLEQSPDESNPGNSGSLSQGSTTSGIVGSGSISNGTTSTGNTTSGGTISKGKITLPAGCENVNGIGFGWLPDYNGASLKVDEGAVGHKNPCFAGYYGQTGLSGWNDGAQITDNIADAQSGGKPYPIFIASVMPQGTPFSQFTKGSTVVTSIANAMTKLTAAGLTVWLRFAHEMNWYDSDKGGNIYTGSTEEFSKAWGVVSDAVKDIPGVYMYWSPNYDSSAADLVSSGWYPTQGAVDIVGMDIYPKSGSSFASTYQNFCQQWPNIPFVVGETGSDNGGSTSDKNAWLKQLTDKSALQACPNYLGFSWFEYLKEGVDFRIATGGNTAAQGVL